jgi:hypothetical protein
MGRISFSKSLHERLTGSCSKFEKSFRKENKTFKPFFDNSCIPLLKQPFCREIIISPGEGGILFYLCPSVQDIFRRIFLSNYWWQKSDIWSQPSYRYPISWEAFFDPSDSYFLFAEERGYHKWALAHSSSCLSMSIWGYWLKADSQKIRNKCIVVLI